MTEVLSQFSDALAATVEQAAHSVVQVNARKRLPATGIIHSADGIILTSHHVVQREDNITVGLPNGETVAAEFVGRDETTDLAILRVQADSLTPARWASPDTLRVGHIVVALGRPGDKILATQGIISALDEAWRTRAGGHIDTYVQTDVVMYPGFSGGPLVAASGEFIGLNTSGLSRGTSLAIPAPTLVRVAESLLEHGHIKRGYLGVGTQPVRLPSQVAEELSQETGLLTVSVEPDSPAEQGGLYVGDIIVALDGDSVKHIDGLLAMLGSIKIGDTAAVTVVRGGQTETLNVTIGERP